MKLLFAGVTGINHFVIVLQNKDEGYIENQQQNISDAIDLLPRLATGIDVNIQFRRFDLFILIPVIYCQFLFVFLTKSLMILSE